MNIKPKCLFAGMSSWHLSHTATACQKIDCLTGFWTSASKPSGISNRLYKRVWPYLLGQKIFYHLPFVDLEERMRWVNLPLYDAWMKYQTLPEGTNVVQGPMGSCKAVFELARNAKYRVLKVFDATNSHPIFYRRAWQSECNTFFPGYKIPMPDWTLRRIVSEIESADCVLCPSHFVRDTMVSNGVSEERCFVSSFGVDTSIFTPRKLLPREPLFICVGSICLRKGHQYLFPAFERLKRVLPNARLVCVGGVRPDFLEQWDQWKHLVEHKEHLSHPEIATLLQSSTAFVLASVEEGFARVLSEAMGSAVPVIATYETGASTSIKNRQEGIIIPARNSDALYYAMLELANNREENIKMGSNAYAAGGLCNTWSAYTGRLLAEYARRLEDLDI